MFSLSWDYPFSSLGSPRFVLPGAPILFGCAHPCWVFPSRSRHLGVWGLPSWEFLQGNLSIFFCRKCFHIYCIQTNTEGPVWHLIHAHAFFWDIFQFLGPDLIFHYFTPCAVVGSVWLVCLLLNIWSEFRVSGFWPAYMQFVRTSHFVSSNNISWTSFHSRYPGCAGQLSGQFHFSRWLFMFNIKGTGQPWNNWKVPR